MQPLQKIFAPSKYQIDIFSWIRKGRGDAVVKAAAGSGKTSTLVEASKLLHTDSAIFLAFNKHIADELSKRVSNMACKTIHSIGHSCLRSHLGKVVLDEQKYLELAKPYAEEIAEGLRYRYIQDLRMWNQLKLEDEDIAEPDEPPTAAAVASQLKQLAHFVRVTLTDVNSRAAVEETCYHYSVLENGFTLDLLYRPLLGMLREGDRLAANRGAIDYDDMLYLPHEWGLQPRTSQWVFVDESQDLSPAQLDLVLKLRSPGGRMLFVGDTHQCQPAGTMVRLTDGSNTPIEQLGTGQTVVTYDRRSLSFVKKGVVTEVAKRYYSGYLYNISAFGKQTKCTDSHKWLVKWSLENKQNAWVTYLMRKDNKWRVGLTKLFFKVTHGARVGSSNDFGLNFRLGAEKADAAWILKIHLDYSEGLAYEQIVAAKFGLPEITFKEASGNNGQTKRFTQELIDSVFESLYPQDESALKCLAAHGRKLEFPFIRKDALRQRWGSLSVFETESCNLVSNFMSILVAPDIITIAHEKEYSSKPQWTPIHISYEWFDDYVYSLNVEKHHKYIADGLVTCNSIFGFAGASCDSVEQIIKRTNATVLPLSICYRCPSSHIKLAQTIVPTIEARENAPEGVVEEVKRSKVAEIIQEGDLVISRCTAPVIKLCIELIANRIPARVRGRDIGKSLTVIVKDVAKHPNFVYDDFGIFLKEYEEKKVAKLEQKKNAQSQIESLRDRIQGIEVCYEAFEVNSVQELCYEIESLFSDGRASVMLSTVHRCKGLENDRVFILEPDKLPLRWQGQQEWQLQQEFCLKYVALTRAKVALYFIK